MSFAIDFATEFFSFQIDLKPDKYLSNVSDLILSMRHNKALEPKVENEAKEDIENSGPCSFLSKGDLQYPSSIFDRYNSRLWDYIINT